MQVLLSVAGLLILYINSHSQLIDMVNSLYTIKDPNKKSDNNNDNNNDNNKNGKILHKKQPLTKKEFFM